MLSVSNHLTWEMQMTFYWEFFRQCLPMALIKLMLSWICYEQNNIVDQTFAVCCDTTSSNTSVFSGAIVLLCTIFNTPLLWFSFRRHMLAVNISHFIGSFTGEKTKAPGGVVCQTSEGLANSQEWDWKLSRLDNPCTKLPVKLCSLGKGPGPWSIRMLQFFTIISLALAINQVIVIAF